MRPLTATSVTSSSFTRLTKPHPTRTLAYLKRPSSSSAPKSLTNKPLSTTTAHRSLVKPQAQTTTSNRNIKIPSPTAATMSTPISANAVLDLIKARRTYYALNKELTISKERVEEIVKDALRHVPSSFNAQSNRVLVLFGAEHDKLWDATSEILKAIVPADSWQHTANRMAGFKAGAATVLFFEDQDVINNMQETIPLYADKFPTWANQSNAMLQFTVWTALEAEGLGANLQHYNPLIDQRVTAEWNLPVSWKLNAQLVVGGRAGEPGPKDFLPLEQMYKVAGN
ncbi:hypothetical protein DL770_001864 [Monosporascus sp. CRB-9-2]|nr:hypothetical protein DL770_001864 [Monosporascus sp. CRB-9-2]